MDDNRSIRALIYRLIFVSLFLMVLWVILDYAR